MEEDLLGATAPLEPPESVEPFEGLSVLSVFKPVLLRRSSLKKGIATSQYVLSYTMFLSFSVPSKRMKAFMGVQSARWVEVCRTMDDLRTLQRWKWCDGFLETNDCVSVNEGAPWLATGRSLDKRNSNEKEQLM